MNNTLNHVDLLLENLHLQALDFTAVFAGKNDLTPLESIELFLLEQQRLRIEKQRLLHGLTSLLKRRCLLLTSVSSQAYLRNRCCAFVI